MSSERQLSPMFAAPTADRQPTAPRPPARVALRSADRAAAERRATPRGAGEYQPLVIVLVASATGIITDRYFPLPGTLWLGLSALAWALWWRNRASDRQRLTEISLLCATGLLFAAWHHSLWYWFPRDAIGAFSREEAEPACLEAIAAEGVRRLPSPPADPLRAIPAGPRSRLVVEIERIRDGAEWRSSSGLAVITLNGALAGIRTGDRLRIVGQLSSPSPPRNPGEFNFAADARAQRREVRIWCEQPECVAVLQSGGWWRLGRWIDAAREYGDRMITRYVQHDRAGLAAALVVGLREQLDIEQNEAFLESGMMHVLSISGLHVGLLALLLFGVLRWGWLPRGVALSAIVLLVASYALVTDAGAPVIRATVMVALVCCSIYLGRPGLQFNSLAAAALIVLAINPSDLFRAGPQLSFLAVAAMAWLYPRLPGRARDEDPLDRLIRHSRPWPDRASRRALGWLTNALLVSAGIWLLTAPLVLARFNVLSPGAIVLNVFFGPPVAVALLSGFGVILFGAIAPPLAAVCGFVCDWNLGLLDRLVAIANALPGSHVWLPGPANWWLVVFYLGCGVLLAWRTVFLTSRVAPRWCIALCAAWIAVGVASSWHPRRAEELSCTFVSVGHGSATVLELPGGETLLYDAGQLGAPATGARAVAATLWSRGLTHLDAVVVSHADVDHFNALPELFERFSVGAVYISTVMLENESPAVQALLAALQKHRIPLREVSAGDRLQAAENVLLEFRHPTREGVLGSDNANSLVLLVEYARRRILLTGDLEGRGLQQVLAEEPLDCDVIAAPHHGSPRSNPPGFAAWSTPEWAIVSGGLGRESETVEQAFTSAGAQVLHTAQAGAITATIRSAELEVTTFRGP